LNFHGCRLQAHEITADTVDDRTCVPDLAGSNGEESASVDIVEWIDMVVGCGQLQVDTVIFTLDIE